MTAIGSMCTRFPIDRTLHLQRNTLPFPDYLYMRPHSIVHSSHSHFFSSRAHLSNSSLFVQATSMQKYFRLSSHRPQRSILPRTFQSRYRRHLSHFQLLFQITRARRSLNQLSRLRIHLVQEFKIGPIQSRKNVFETNIVVIHDHIPQLSLPHSSFLRSRPHSRQHDDVCLTTPTSSSSSSSSFSKVF